MTYLTTPPQRFATLADFPFSEHYLRVSAGQTNQQSPHGLNLHYVDEGPRDGEVVLMLHGEPSWSYLYRNMISPVAAAGYRVIAPDLIGFGKSDKPIAPSDYSYQNHVDWIRALILQLKLHDITLVCQDWGGLIGLRLVAEHPALFARVMAANTMLPTGDHPPGDAFLQWQKYSQQVDTLPIADIINNATVKPLSDQSLAAYDAPFPDESYKAGARIFPMLVPTTPDDPASAANRLAWQSLQQFTQPFITAFSDSDPITRGGDRILQKCIPGCQGQAHCVIKNGGHFLQEDQPQALTHVLLDFIRANPLPAGKQ